MNAIIGIGEGRKYLAWHLAQSGEMTKSNVLEQYHTFRPRKIPYESGERKSAMGDSEGLYHVTAIAGEPQTYQLLYRCSWASLGKADGKL
jgi:hypothetical protein